MGAVTTRELKQNPAEVLRRVQASQTAFEITSYGKPTGVCLVAASAPAESWASGAVLNQVRLTEINARERENMHQVLADLYSAEDYL